MFSPPVSNRFCDDWIQAFLNAAERCNPFLLRQILENFKLKVRKPTHRQTITGFLKLLDSGRSSYSFVIVKSS